MFRVFCKYYLSVKCKGGGGGEKCAFLRKLPAEILGEYGHIF
jgi:hypothetical protein